MNISKEALIEKLYISFESIELKKTDPDIDPLDIALAAEFYKGRISAFLEVLNLNEREEAEILDRIKDQIKTKNQARKAIA